MEHHQHQLQLDPELLEKLFHGAILISFGLILFH